MVMESWGETVKLMHAGVIVSDLKRATTFYGDILGLPTIERSELSFDGLWFGLEEGQQIHLMLLDNPYVGCDRPQHGGRDNHIALQCDAFDLIRSRLEVANIPFTLSKSGRKALFCRDPDGNTIELIGSLEKDCRG